MQVWILFSSTGGFAQQSPFPVGPWAGALLGILRVAPISSETMSMPSGWLGPQNGEMGPWKSRCEVAGSRGTRRQYAVPLIYMVWGVKITGVSHPTWPRVLNFIHYASSSKIQLVQIPIFHLKLVLPLNLPIVNVLTFLFRLSGSRSLSSYHN